MAFRTNVREGQDREEFLAYKEVFKEDLKGIDVFVKFDEHEVSVDVANNLSVITRGRWNKWVKKNFKTDHDIPGLPPLTDKQVRNKGATGQTRNVATAAPTGKGVAVKATDDFWNEYAHRALQISLEESAGELGRNRARFQRGELMSSLNSASKAVKRTMKATLEDLNRRTLALAERNAVLTYEPITEQEASATRKVVEAFGSSGEFRLVNAISDVTGEPVVADDGKPPLVAVTDVALNKLAPLTGAADGDFDTLLSFAYRNTERVVKRAKAVAKQAGRPLLSVIADLDDARVDGVHVVTGETIKVQPDATGAMRLLKDMAGDDPTPDVVSIKTDRGWYETFFVPLRALMSAAVSRYAPNLPLNQDGLVSNVFVLEHIISQYFNVHESEGKAAALASLAEAETITKNQAGACLASLAWDPEAGEWTDVESEEVYEEEDVDWGDDNEVSDDDDDDGWSDDDDPWDDDDDDAPF